MECDDCTRRHIALVPAMAETDNIRLSMDETMEMVAADHIRKAPECRSESPANAVHRPSPMRVVCSRSRSRCDAASIHRQSEACASAPRAEPGSACSIASASKPAMAMRGRRSARGFRYDSAAAGASSRSSITRPVNYEANGFPIRRLYLRRRRPQKHRLNHRLYQSWASALEKSPLSAATKPATGCDPTPTWE